MVNLIELPINAIEAAEETPFLANYFPNIFAEALVPLNPQRWPAYLAGSAMASDMPEFGDKVATPFTNLLTAKEYLETSQSDVQWRDRFWKVVEDTFTVNGASELGGELGSFGAGAAANKMADKYMEEMVETSFTLKASEKLNQRIYQQFAKEMGSDPSLVRGTGLGRQFVPHASRGNILDRPSRGSRPLWAQKPFQGPSRRGPFGLITPLVFHKRSALQLSKLLLTKKQYSVVKELVIIYSYFRYVKFVVKIEKRCVKSIPKAYQTLKIKINSKIISIRRRRRERYLKKLQKNNIPG